VNGFSCYVTAHFTDLKASHSHIAGISPFLQTLPIPRVSTCLERLRPAREARIDPPRTRGTLHNNSVKSWRSHHLASHRCPIPAVLSTMKPANFICSVIFLRLNPAHLLLVPGYRFHRPTVPSQYLYRGRSIGCEIRDKSCFDGCD